MIRDDNLYTISTFIHPRTKDHMPVVVTTGGHYAFKLQQQMVRSLRGMHWHYYINDLLGDSYRFRTQASKNAMFKMAYRVHKSRLFSTPRSKPLSYKSRYKASLKRATEDGIWDN